MANQFCATITVLERSFTSDLVSAFVRPHTTPDSSPRTFPQISDHRIGCRNRTPSYWQSNIFARSMVKATYAAFKGSTFCHRTKEQTVILSKPACFRQICQARTLQWREPEIGVSVSIWYIGKVQLSVQVNFTLEQATKA